MLLDTSGLLCYYHAGESQHGDAVAFFKAAPTRLTHSYILSEFVPLCHARRLNPTRVLAFAADLLTILRSKSFGWMKPCTVPH